MPTRADRQNNAPSPTGGDTAGGLLITLIVALLGAWMLWSDRLETLLKSLLP